MNPVWMHLLVNHIPIIATAFALVTVLVGLVIKNDVVRKTGLIMYVVAGLSVYAANLTGEPAEEMIENIPGVSEQQIEKHQEAAELTVTLMSIALFLALVHLFNRPPAPTFQRLVLTAFLIVGIAAGIQAMITGHEGGLIRRPDLQSTQQVSTPTHTDGD
jgi:uncharacterized membrane protein